MVVETLDTASRQLTPERSTRLKQVEITEYQEPMARFQEIHLKIISISSGNKEAFAESLLS